MSWMSSTADARSVADLDFYSVRCVFRNDGYVPAAYEERITLWRSASLDESRRP